MRALRARMAKTNEALWSSWPWKKAEDPEPSGDGSSGLPQSTPPSPTDTPRPRAPSSAAPSRYKQVRNWTEWPVEHGMEYMRILTGRETHPTEPPKGFRPTSSRIPDPRPVISLPRTVSDGEWEKDRVTGCWNCGQDQRLHECPERVGNRRFCFGCGRLDFTKNNCTKCKGWWKKGLEEYWKESLSIEM